MSYQTDCLYNIYEAVLIFHFYVINIVPAPRAHGAHPHTPKATQICELDLEFDQGLFTLLICLSVKTVSQVSKQQSVTVVSVKSQVEFYFSNQFKTYVNVKLRRCAPRRLNSKRKLFPWNCVVIYHKKGGCVEKNNKRARARFAGDFFHEIDFSVDKYRRR